MGWIGRYPGFHHLDSRNAIIRVCRSLYPRRTNEVYRRQSDSRDEHYSYDDDRPSVDLPRPCLVSGSPGDQRRVRPYWKRVGRYRLHRDCSWRCVHVFRLCPNLQPLSGFCGNARGSGDGHPFVAGDPRHNAHVLLCREPLHGDVFHRARRDYAQRSCLWQSVRGGEHSPRGDRDCRRGCQYICFRRNRSAGNGNCRLCQYHLSSPLRMEALPSFKRPKHTKNLTNTSTIVVADPSICALTILKYAIA